MITIPLTEPEIQDLVENWYAALDTHADTDEMLSYLADKGMEMRFPEAKVRGHAQFSKWYDGIIHTYFDEVHTLQELDIEITDNGMRAVVHVVGRWEASRWKAPAAKSERLQMLADQTWTIIRQTDSGQSVIQTYIVNSLTPLPGSVPL
ncbi:MAG: hypothetical protein IPO91_33535 [Chloroflexi bacterium]|jgi:ketosteroid isomerase-like protein|uniref:YybH family protein n=1 Tax=Candidatus Flexifilum breve TaxID=3140694 RepID=UPI0031367634|nr:hypothetical protein [Chloroflexota bacterium]MBK9751662.1 hypothetical protein [Chloroflexota bacterium]